VGVANVWVQTQGDGLVRADRIIGIDAHQTPAVHGKPARWLLDVVLGSCIGHGTREAARESWPSTGPSGSQVSAWPPCTSP
jgi:hypothetical protein